MSASPRTSDITSGPRNTKVFIQSETVEAKTYTTNTYQIREMQPIYEATTLQRTILESDES